MEHPGLGGGSQEGNRVSKSMSMGEWGRQDWMWVGFAIQGGCFAGNRKEDGVRGQRTGSPEMVAGVKGTGEKAG